MTAPMTRLTAAERVEGSAAPEDRTPVHDARWLVGAGTCARIVLDGQVYTLRITRAGKLILTK
jgi:hemin uptake protein HemP